MTETIQCGRCRVAPCVCGIAGDPATDGLPLAESTQPLFEQRAERSLSEVTATFGERGAQYGDTWRNCQWLVLKASLRELGHKIPDNHLEAIASAAFVDMKYQRYEGGYKRDHGIDGIAYAALHADAMRELKEGNPQ